MYKGVIVQDVFNYLDSLEIGKYILKDFVKKVNRLAWIEVCKHYIDSHPEVYLTSDLTAVKKINISGFYKKEDASTEEQKV